MKTIVYLYYAVASVAVLAAAAVLGAVVAPFVVPVYVWHEMRIGEKFRNLYSEDNRTLLAVWFFGLHRFQCCRKAAGGHWGFDGSRWSSVDHGCWEQYVTYTKPIATETWLPDGMVEKAGSR